MECGGGGGGAPLLHLPPAHAMALLRGLLLEQRPTNISVPDTAGSGSFLPDLDPHLRDRVHKQCTCTIVRMLKI